MTEAIPRKKSISNLKKYAEDYGMIAPFMIIFFIFTVIPVVISMILSVTNFNVLSFPKFVGLKNYYNLFLNDELFRLSMKNTILFAAITGPAGYILSFVFAWLINEFQRRTRSFFTLLFYFPSISGSAFLIWQIVFSNDSYGYLNALLISLQVIYEPIQWLADPNYLVAACLVVILWQSLGSGFLAFIAGFKNLDYSLYEAASVDGIKNRWQELWYITLPMMKPQLMFSAVMSITGSFGIGEIITGLAGFPTTGYAGHTVVHHLQDYGSIRFEMGYACAIATILFALMMLINKAVQKLLSSLGQ